MLATSPLATAVGIAVRILEVTVKEVLWHNINRWETVIVTKTIF